MKWQEEIAEILSSFEKTPIEHDPLKYQQCVDQYDAVIDFLEKLPNSETLVDEMQNSRQESSQLFYLMSTHYQLVGDLWDTKQAYKRDSAAGLSFVMWYLSSAWQEHSSVPPSAATYRLLAYIFTIGYRFGLKSAAHFEEQ